MRSLGPSEDLHLDTLRQTFEIDDWNNNFKGILGQPFLNAHLAELSWESEDGESYMVMKLFPDRHKAGWSMTM